MNHFSKLILAAFLLLPSISMVSANKKLMMESIKESEKPVLDMDEEDEEEMAENNIDAKKIQNHIIEKR